MRLKILDMNDERHQKILLSYFFKKKETLVDTKELLSLSCIHYDSQQQKIFSHTKRFLQELQPYQDIKVFPLDVDALLQKLLGECFGIHEELVRCDLCVGGRTDYFYIAVIGVDFYQVEIEYKKG